MFNRITGIASALLVCLAGYVGYELTKANLKADIYRDRLEALSNDYDQLRETYNRAVRKTAVTELVVDGGKLCVSIRDSRGVVQSIPTPFDPSGEIYVDYVVLDGRLWVRRVFDADTPPSDGVVVDPKIAAVNWDAKTAKHGKAVYRQLTEGRWVVTVTGDGSLGLARKSDNDPTDLTTQPQIQEYEPITEQAQAQVEGIGPAEVVKRLVGVGE